MSSIKSPSWLSSSSPIGVSRLIGSFAIFITFLTFSKGICSLDDSSSGVGSLPISWSICLPVLTSLLMVSIIWTGILIVLAWSAIDLVIACLIHHVAYVENLYPLRYSNLSTAFIKPILPSWIKSRNWSPLFVYFLAIDITSLKLASTISFFADLASFSPFWTCCTILLNSLMSIPIYWPISAISFLISSILSPKFDTKFSQPLVLSLETFSSQTGSSSDPLYFSINSFLLILDLSAILTNAPSRPIIFLLIPYNWSINASILLLCKCNELTNSTISFLKFWYFFSSLLVNCFFSFNAASILLSWREESLEYASAIFFKIFKTWGLREFSIAANDTFAWSSSKSSFSSTSEVSLSLSSSLVELGSLKWLRSLGEFSSKSLFFKSEIELVFTNFSRLFSEFNSSSLLLPNVASRSITSLNMIFSSKSSSRQIVIAWKVNGLSHNPLM